MGNLPELKPYLKMKLVREGAIFPTKRVEDGFFDLYAVYDEDAVFLYPGDLKLLPLGLSTEFPKNWVFRILERSGTSSKGIAIRCGVIDSGYRGEYFVAVNNTINKLIILTNKTEDEIKKKFSTQLKGYENKFIIFPQSKGIAQGGLTYAPHIEIEEVHELDETSLRGAGALGSSGK